MSIERRISKTFALMTAALLAASLFSAVALAAPEQTRESYAAEVEPICKTNTKANERILHGVRQEIQKGKLKPAATKFAKAAAAFGSTVSQIKKVPQPTADKTKLTKWIGLLQGEQKLLTKIGKALKSGNKHLAQAESVRLNHNSNLANNAVLGFEFNYCLIDSSRFS